MTLTTSTTQLANQQFATLTVTWDSALNSTRDDVAVYDITTGQREDYCSCTVSGETSYTLTGIPWAATPQTYEADMSPGGAAPGSPDVVATSNPVTIDPKPWSISLTSSASQLSPGQFATLTATANQPVSRVYDIAIYDLTTGQ